MNTEKEYMQYLHDHFEKFLHDKQFYIKYGLVFIDSKTEKPFENSDKLSYDSLYFLILMLYFEIPYFYFQNNIIKKKVYQPVKKDFQKTLSEVEKEIKDMYQVLEKNHAVLHAKIFFEIEIPNIDKEFIEKYLQDTKTILDHIEIVKKQTKNKYPYFGMNEFTNFHTRKSQDKSAIRNLIIQYTIVIGSICFGKEVFLLMKQYWYHVFEYICPKDLLIVSNDFYKYIEKKILDDLFDNEVLFEFFNNYMPFDPETKKQFYQYKKCRCREKCNCETNKQYVEKFIFDNLFYENFDRFRYPKDYQ